MILHEVKLLHAFNAWADNRIFEVAGMLSSDQAMRDMKTSHGSIHGTLLHLVGAEKMWLSRWMGKPDATFITTADAPTISALKTLWEKVGYDTAKLLGSMSQRKLEDTFTMTTSTGDTVTHVFWQTFQHLVDHSTYHRGQIVTLLRQMGIAPPPTGLIRFYTDSGKSGQTS